MEKASENADAGAHDITNRSGLTLAARVERVYGRGLMRLRTLYHN